MSVSQDLLVRRTKALLGIADTNFQSTITGSLAIGGTSVTVEDGAEWTQGDIVEFLDGDLAYVQSVAGSTLTIKRSHLGATAAAHNSGDVIYKNPSVFIKDIQEALTLTLQSLWPYIWTSKTTALTLTGATWESLPADVIDVINMSQQHGASLENLGFFGSSGNLKPMMVNHNLPTAVSATNIGVAFPHGTYSGEDVNVVYRAKIVGTLTTGNYTEISDGVEADCVSYGAAARLALAQEGPKVLAEDQAQGEVNVGSGDRTQLWSVLNSKHYELRNQWYDELYRTAAAAGVTR